MATYVPAKSATQLIFWVGLRSQADSTILQVNPTLAAGDVKVSKDGGALANLTTLPAVTPAGSKLVKVTLSATEMTADNVTVVFSDAAGAEWMDLTINIPTAARQIDDLTFPTTSGRSTDVTATGEVGLDFANVAVPDGPVPAIGILEGGTAQSATSTTLVGRAAETGANSIRVGCIVAVFGSDQGYWQTRVCTAYTTSTDTYTVDSWDVTPSGTITYRVFAGAPPSSSAPVPANVTQLLGTAWLTPGTAGTPDVNITAIDGVIAAAKRLALSGGVMSPGAVDTSLFTPTTIEFEATMTDTIPTTADRLNGRTILFLSGAMILQACSIIDYAKVGSLAHFTVSIMASAPANAVTFIII